MPKEIDYNGVRELALQGESRDTIADGRGLSGQAKRTLLNAIRNPDTVSCAFADGSALTIDFNGFPLSLLRRERRLIRDIWKALDRFEESGGEWE